MINLLPNVGQCPGCCADWSGNATSTKIASAADASLTGFADFSIRACAGCGMGFTSPVPSPQTAGELYSNRNSANFDAEGGPFVSAVKDRLARRFLRRLSTGRPVRRVLDYSTGNGRYARAASHSLPGAQVIATDFLPQPPEALRREKSIQYVSTQTFDADMAIGDFDLIILRHVLEHTYDPREQLGMLRDRLAPGGEIYIEVPNLRCAWAPFIGRYFPGYYAPYHVFHFERNSLRHVIEASGLIGDVHENHMPMVGNVLSRRWGIEETLTVKLFGIALFPLQFLIERIAGNASAINVRARRANPTLVASP